MSSDLRFAKTHEWVKVEEDVAVVGITPYAVEQLGDVVYIEFPEEGDEVQQGAAFGEIESVKAASELNAPVSGTVVAANTGLEDNYDVLAEDAFGKGWIIKLRMNDTDQIQSLMTREQYDTFVEEEE